MFEVFSLILVLKTTFSCIAIFTQRTLDGIRTQWERGEGKTVKFTSNVFRFISTIFEFSNLRTVGRWDS